MSLKIVWQVSYKSLELTARITKKLDLSKLKPGSLPVKWEPKNAF